MYKNKENEQADNIKRPERLKYSNIGQRPMPEKRCHN
jgi:hypothetical protein